MKSNSRAHGCEGEVLAREHPTRSHRWVRLLLMRMNRSVVKSGTMVTDCVKKISRHLIFTGIQIKLNTSGVVPTSHNPQVSKSARKKRRKLQPCAARGAAGSPVLELPLVPSSDLPSPRPEGKKKRFQPDKYPRVSVLCPAKCSPGGATPGVSSAGRGGCGTSRIIQH